MSNRPSDFALASIIASLTALAGLPACGSSDAPSEQPSCQDRDGLVCNPPGFRFVVSAVAVSDYCFTTPENPASCPATTIPPTGSTTARLTEATTGKLCMAGTVASDGFAVLALRFFDSRNPDGTFVTKFHPVAAGITAIEATIDSPPSGGLTLSRIGGFHVERASNPGVPVVVTMPGSLMVPLSGFVSDDSPPVTLAPDDVQTLGFNVPAGNYEFCVHDFKFLNAASHQVTP